MPEPHERQSCLRVRLEPVSSPHNLWHRRISLLHRQGNSWAESGRLVGQRKLFVISDTYNARPLRRRRDGLRGFDLGLMKLFHYTTAEAADEIDRNGFHDGRACPTRETANCGAASGSPNAT